MRDDVAGLRLVGWTAAGRLATARPGSCSRTRSRPSIVKWSWVQARGYVRPVLVTFRPTAMSGVAACGAIGVEAHPVAHAAGGRPAVTQRHRDREVRLAGERPTRRSPGSARRDPAARGRRWPRPAPARSSGLKSAALSQVSLVIGSGTSWSQPLLANRPSSTLASRSRTSSRFSVESGPGVGRAAATALATARPCKRRFHGRMRRTREQSRRAGIAARRTRSRPPRPRSPSGTRGGRSRRARSSRTPRAGRRSRAPSARRRAARSSAESARRCRRWCGRLPTTRGNGPRAGARWPRARSRRRADPVGSWSSTRFIRAANSRSAGASYAGFPPRMTSVSTCPLPIAAASSLRVPVLVGRRSARELDGLADVSRAPRSSRGPGRGRAAAGDGPRR